MDRLVAHFRAMARNNGWANDRLLEACEGLTPEEFTAPRTSFFPSLRATLNHNFGADTYYLNALECEDGHPAVPAEWPDFAEASALRAAQAASDARLIAFSDRLDAGDLDFQHPIHHRGRAHAMLAGTRVKPPPLDEFFLDFDRQTIAHCSVGAAAPV